MLIINTSLYYKSVISVYYYFIDIKYATMLLNKAKSLWKRGNVENIVPEKSISTNNTIVTEKCQSGCAKAANILQQIDSDVDNEEGFDIQDSK